MGEYVLEIGLGLLDSTTLTQSASARIEKAKLETHVTDALANLYPLVDRRQSGLNIITRNVIQPFQKRRC